MVLSALQYGCMVRITASYNMIGDSWASLARRPIATDLRMLETANMERTGACRTLTENRIVLGFKIRTQATECITQNFKRSHSLCSSYQHLSM
jgi:hypothetical protein